ncbi:hypothetical protein OCU04_012483 [Sclerotinia nivalis]|uniref:Rhodopsin domain-containing protein n=1 Tax=Sclerotinia nivalis TaxID=352851 RepID=A0A9X0A8P2_9HELO|nr:hypothetical protein OCU04_012483 [Sclerotinia nivalis]
MVLSGLALIGRIVSRRIKHVALSASDFLIIGGIMGAWVISLIVIEDTKLGLGHHIQYVPLKDLRQKLLTTYIAEIFYSITFSMIKISILLLYRSIFPNKTMTLATNLIAIFVLLWGISSLLVSIFSCEPINGFWDLTVESKCIDSKWFFVGNSIPNILADIVILGLPMPDLWHLRMSRRSKAAVSGMFLLGGFVIVASGLRMYFMLKMDVMDITWSYVGLALWSAVEIDVAVISACLPTLRPVLTYLVPSILRSKRLDTGPLKESKESGQIHMKGEKIYRLPEYTIESMENGYRTT